MDSSTNNELHICLGDMWISKHGNEGVIIIGPGYEHSEWLVQPFDGKGWKSSLALSQEKLENFYNFNETGSLPAWHLKKDKTVYFNSALKMMVTEDRRLVRIDPKTGALIPRPSPLENISLY